MLNMNKKSRELLQLCIQRHNPTLLPMIKSKNDITYDANFYNKLREAVGDEFCDKGLLSNDEPNEYGLRLEELIDEIGRMFM